MIPCIARLLAWLEAWFARDPGIAMQVARRQALQALADGARAWADIDAAHDLYPEPNLQQLEAIRENCRRIETAGRQIAKANREYERARARANRRDRWRSLCRKP